jgi:hypothetical protein
MMTTTHEQKEEPATFEKVWAALMENRRQMADMSKEADRRRDETDRQIKETDRIIKDTALQMKETDKRVGEISNRFGDMVESMVVPNLVARFSELGYDFEDTSPNKEIRDRVHNIHAEVDAYLENEACVMIVETKVKPSLQDVDDHIKRMEKLRAIADYRKDNRKYYGAIAGVVLGEKVKAYILSKGFFAIEPSGETFTITAPAGPGIW